MTVPAMILDGKRVQGTLDISEALDAAFPANPQFPSDPEAHARVREAGAKGDRSIYRHVRPVSCAGCK